MLTNNSIMHWMVSHQANINICTVVCIDRTLTVLRPDSGTYRCAESTDNSTYLYANWPLLTLKFMVGECLCSAKCEYRSGNRFSLDRPSLPTQTHRKQTGERADTHCHKWPFWPHQFWRDYSHPHIQAHTEHTSWNSWFPTETNQHKFQLYRFSQRMAKFLWIC